MKAAAIYSLKKHLIFCKILIRLLAILVKVQQESFEVFEISQWI